MSVLANFPSAARPAPNPPHARGGCKCRAHRVARSQTLAPLRAFGSPPALYKRPSRELLLALCPPPSRLPAAPAPTVIRPPKSFLRRAVEGELVALHGGAGLGRSCSSTHCDLCRTDSGSRQLPRRGANEDAGARGETQFAAVLKAEPRRLEGSLRQIPSGH